jgi:hypothetical protein
MDYSFVDAHRPTACSQTDVHRIYTAAKINDWTTVSHMLTANPSLALSSIPMNNKLKTTLLHQAIASKHNVTLRTAVMKQILEQTPRAARMVNGYGSLPLHMIAQRNTNLPNKEHIIVLLVQSYQEGLLIPAGAGMRTPLHILFTDYMSPELTNLLIQRGPQACCMRDKNGWLPAHVAASRHCSPLKLRMLLDVYPETIYAKTSDGESLMDLALRTSTATHPNFKLIECLNECMGTSVAPAHVHKQKQRRVGTSKKRKTPLSCIRATVSGDDDEHAHSDGTSRCNSGPN